MYAYTQTHVLPETERQGVRIYFKELAHGIWGLANLQSVGQAGRLEMQPGFLFCSLEAKFLLLWKTSLWTHKAFN